MIDWSVCQINVTAEEPIRTGDAVAVDNYDAAWDENGYLKSLKLRVRPARQEKGEIIIGAAAEDRQSGEGVLFLSDMEAVRALATAIDQDTLASTRRAFKQMGLGE